MKAYIVLSLAFLFFSCKKESSTAQTQPQEGPSGKEVLLIGTFHYNNPGADVAKTKSFDILNEKSQHELEEISSSIKKYKPTKIFVEWPYNEQKDLDSLYQLYVEGNYFTNDSLSDFYLKNEIFQLAFRAAKEIKLETVYGIDYTETSFPYGEVMEDIEQNNQTNLKEEIQDGISKFTVDFDHKIESGASLKELTHYLNSPEMRSFSNHFHNNLMPLAGKPNDFSGPFLTAEWFKRNLYMWSMVQKMTTASDERVMVLVGVSHAAMFELFIDQNSRWKVLELEEVIDK